MLAAFWDLLGEKEGAGGDEEVFLFFSVHPLNDALGEQVAEGGFAAAEFLKMTRRKRGAPSWRMSKGRRIRPLSVLMKMSRFSAS